MLGLLESLPQFPDVYLLNGAGLVLYLLSILWVAAPWKFLVVVPILRLYRGGVTGGKS